jgi:cell division protein FtsW (lipid II flippase)
MSQLSNPTTSTITEQLMLRLKVPTKLRNLEATLIVFAMAVTSAALALVDLGATGKLNPPIIGLSLGLGAIVLAIHVAQRFVARDADPLILPIVTLLNGLGIAMIHRLDLAAGLTGWQANASRQMVWTAIATVVAIVVIVTVRNHRVLQRYRYVWMLTGVILLVLPLVPFIGVTINGARLWVNLGFVSFQPGEIAKIALALFFAGYLVTARDSLSVMGQKVLGVRWPRTKDLGPILVVWAVAMLVLVFQRDLGTSLLYFGLFLVLMYVATGRAIWFVVGGGLFGSGALIASQFLTYVQGRFAAWLDSFNQANYEAIGGSYQLVQGLFGFANGGIIGTVRVTPASCRSPNRTTSWQVSAKSSVSSGSSQSSRSTSCSSLAECESGSTVPTISGDCSPSVSPSSLRCRYSSWSAASHASFPSPDSRHRSSPRVVRRSSRTGSSSRCCFDSPTPCDTNARRWQAHDRRTAQGEHRYRGAFRDPVCLHNDHSGVPG